MNLKQAAKDALKSIPLAGAVIHSGEAAMDALTKRKKRIDELNAQAEEWGKGFETYKNLPRDI